MKRYHGLSRRLISASLVIALLGMAISIGLTSSLSLAEGAPEVEWEYTFDNAGNEDGVSIQQTSDGGYIIAAWTYSQGAEDVDVWLIKTDSSGSETWNRTFGGADTDLCSSVQQTSDGGYVVGGYTYPFDSGQADAWLIKTDSSGSETWSRTFGGVGWDACNSVQQTSDGGYIIGGSTTSFGTGGGWLMKTDSSGSETWNKTFGASAMLTANSVQQTSDGGYIIAGEDIEDAWLIKTDSSGSETWNKTFSWTEIGAGYNSAVEVQQTSDGGYVVGGYTYPFDSGQADAWLIKTDSSGSETWNRTFDGGGYEECMGVQQTSDGGYIIGGFTDSFGAGDNDAWLIKTDSNGDIQWDKTFGGAGFDMCWSVQQTSDGGYVFTGTTFTYRGDVDAWLVKVGSEPTPVTDQVDTATGTGAATLSSNSGTIEDLTAIAENDLPPEAAETMPDIEFPHGFFSFNVTGLTPGQSVDITITLPDPVPVGTQYWKWGPTPGNTTDHWYQLLIGDDDGDNVIIITLQDNGLGDDIVTVEDSMIIDQGGPGSLPEEGGCFIATAAYGTATAREIDTLRSFRDEVLLESTVGSKLVEWYYQTSPPIADFISENSLLGTLVRELFVDPIASLVEATEAIWGN